MNTAYLSPLRFYLVCIFERFTLGRCRVDKFVLGISAAEFGTISQQSCERGDLQFAANELGGIVPARLAGYFIAPRDTKHIYRRWGFRNFRDRASVNCLLVCLFSFFRVAVEIWRF